MAVPVARGVTPALVTSGLRRQAWLIEAGGLANGSEELGLPGPIDSWAGPVDSCEGCGRAGQAWALSMKVRDLGGCADPDLVNKNEGLDGRTGPVTANRSEGFWVYGPRASRPTLFGKSSCVHAACLHRGSMRWT